MTEVEFASDAVYPAHYVDDQELLALLVQNWVKEVAAAGYGPAGTPRAQAAPKTDRRPDLPADDPLAQLWDDVPSIFMVGPVVKLTALPVFVPTRETVEGVAESFYTCSVMRHGTPWSALMAYVRNRYMTIAVSALHRFGDELVIDSLRYLRDNKVDHELPPEVLDRVIARLTPRAGLRRN